MTVNCDLKWFTLFIFLFVTIPPNENKEHRLRLGVVGNIKFGPFAEPMQDFTPETDRYIRSNSSHKDKKLRAKKDKHKDTTESFSNKVSQLHGVRKFIVLIYKKNMDIFEDIKRKIHPPLRAHIEQIKKEYTDKFIEFVNTTQHHNVKTRTGSQKVIMNTIDVSDSIVRRLITNLVQYMNRRGILRSTVENTERLFEGELEKERLRHYQSACDKLNICRTNQAFSKFNVDMLNKIIQADNDKVKQAMDSLTESLREADLHNMLGGKEGLLKHLLTQIEVAPPDAMRTRFFLHKNVITNRYRPLILYKDSNERMVKKTLAFTDLIDLMDKVLPPNQNNTADFDDILMRVNEWTSGFTNDIQQTMRDYVNIYVKTYKNANEKTQQSMQNYLVKMIS